MKTYITILYAILLNLMCIESKEEAKSKFIDKSVMAHRGFWGYYPEHSLKGFELAYFMGSNYLETDINVTKDGKLIIHHDAYLDDSTNINEISEYNSRRRNVTIDGVTYLNKHFVSDFTYDELKQLYLIQRKPQRPQIYNKEFRILLIEELIEMTIALNQKNNRTIGIYIEPKVPQYYTKEGISINHLLEELLRKYNLLDQNSKEFRECPIVIQSFEYETLVHFKERANLPIIALMKWSSFYNIEKLAKVSDGVGVNVDFILYERIDDLLYVNGTYYENLVEYASAIVKPFTESVQDLGKRIMSMERNMFVQYAASLGLTVQVWDLNNDAPKFSYDPAIEFIKLYSLGVSAFFSDFCDTALFSLRHSKLIVQS